MSKTYKWGIIGPGKIADKFARALKIVPNTELLAVASRDENKAKAFASKYGAGRFYGNYEAIVKDPDVDIVYVATPHSFHHLHTMICLENKKAVLCEKPLSVNYESTFQMVSAARSHQTFLMEAMWTRFLPTITKTLRLIAEGEIGEVKTARADFGFVFPYDPSSRIYDLKLGGGSLLDVGVYPLFLILLIFGIPDDIKSFAHLSETGADETTSALLCYNDGRTAQILSSVTTQTPVTAEICGTKGIIMMQPPWYKGSEIEVRKNGIVSDIFSLPYGDNGFEFEIMEVLHCLEKGATESSLMALDFSLQMSKVLDEICTQCNIKYPQ